MAEALKHSFKVSKAGWTGATLYSLLFLKNRVLFLKEDSQYKIKGTSTIVGNKVDGAVGAVIGSTLDKKIRETSRSRELDKENLEIFYKDISKIEMRESTTKFGKSIITGVISIESNNKKRRFDIAPNQSFEECRKIVRTFLFEKTIIVK